MRASIEQMGILSPVLVATAVEATRIVLVDGFKRIATDRVEAVEQVGIVKVQMGRAASAMDKSGVISGS